MKKRRSAAAATIPEGSVAPERTSHARSGRGTRVMIKRQLIYRLIAQKTRHELGDIEQILNTYNDVVRTFLAAGGNVRFLDGWITVVTTKPTRRRHPRTGKVTIPRQSRGL
jgi:hypothetical protein